MSKNDELLVEQSLEYTDGSDWDLISSLMDQAESDQARRILKDRQSFLYHKEESFADQL